MSRRLRLGDLAFAFLNFMVVYSLWPIEKANLWELAAGLGTVWYSWAFSFVISEALKAKWDRIVLGHGDIKEQEFVVASPWGDR